MSRCRIYKNKVYKGYASPHQYPNLETNKPTRYVYLIYIPRSNRSIGPFDIKSPIRVHRLTLHKSSRPRSPYPIDAKAPEA